MRGRVYETAFRKNERIEVRREYIQRFNWLAGERN